MEYWSPQNGRTGPTWHADLIQLGYRDPLPAPVPGIQATLSAMNPTEVHKFIQDADLAAISAAGDDGEPPLLLTVLDLSQWTRVFECANTDLHTALERLKELHAALHDILLQEEKELELAKRNTAVVEVAIRHANNQTEDTGASLSQISMPEAGSFSHPFLANLCIDDAHKAALEDFQDNILSTQMEKEQEQLVSSGKQLAIPFVPQRTVEDLVSTKNHRVWSTGNINSLAPILTSTWRIWAGLSKKEIDECKEAALQSKMLISNGQNIINAFALYGFDHGKCSVTNVKLHIKSDVPTANDRREKHAQEMWNVYRPYMRCACHPKSNNGCSGSFIWWDHAAWYMINHLDKFFPDSTFPSLKAKFIAFLIWMQGAGRTAIRCQVAFSYTRTWMCEAAIVFAANPTGRILGDLPDLPGPRKIERLLKPPSFSVANPGTPSNAPPTKKQKINLNTPPPPGRQSNPGFSYGRGRGSYGRGRNSGGGRGSNLHRRYNAPAQNLSPFQYYPATPRSQRLTVFSEGNGNSSNSNAAKNAGAASSPIIEEIPRSPIRGRFLSFTED